MTNGTNRKGALQSWIDANAERIRALERDLGGGAGSAREGVTFATRAEGLSKRVGQALGDLPSPVTPEPVKKVEREVWDDVLEEKPAARERPRTGRGRIGELLLTLVGREPPLDAYLTKHVTGRKRRVAIRLPRPQRPGDARYAFTERIRVQKVRRARTPHTWRERVAASWARLRGRGIADSEYEPWLEWEEIVERIEVPAIPEDVGRGPLAKAFVERRTELREETSSIEDFRAEKDEELAQLQERTAALQGETAQLADRVRELATPTGAPERIQKVTADLRDLSASVERDRAAIDELERTLADLKRRLS